MARPRAADDFEAIRARLQEVQRERTQALRGTENEPRVESYRDAVGKILGSSENTGPGSRRSK